MYRFGMDKSGYRLAAAKRQIGIVVIGFNKLIVKLEFVGPIPSPGGKVPRRGG